MPAPFWGVGQRSSITFDGRKQEAASRRDGQAQPANAGKFECWSTNIDPQNGTKEIQFNPLNPTDRQTKITPEGHIDAASGRGYAQPFTLIRIILADCGWRQDRLQFWNSVENGLNKRV